MQILKLGFVGLRAVDVDAMQHHYKNVVGLAPSTDPGDGSLYFACGAEHHALSLIPSDRPGFVHAGFPISTEQSLSEAANEAREYGLEAEVVSDVMPGLAKAVSVLDPDGYQLYLYHEMSNAPTPYGVGGVGPDRIGHLSMLSSDNERARQAYCDLFGFRWTDSLGPFVFLSCNADHHVINFVNSPNRGMFHVAFDVRDRSEVARAADVLAINKVAVDWGPGRHSAGHNVYLYHRDPDGNIVEFCAELDRMSDPALGCWDPRPYHAEFPQRPRVWSFDETPWGTPLPDVYRPIVGGPAPAGSR